jgi:hypothetical protein
LQPHPSGGAEAGEGVPKISRSFGQPRPHSLPIVHSTVIRFVDQIVELPTVTSSLSRIVRNDN